MYNANSRMFTEVDQVYLYALRSPSEGLGALAEVQSLRDEQDRGPSSITLEVSSFPALPMLSLSVMHIARMHHTG